MSGSLDCLRLHLEGKVQGVGFRPFVYRLAHRFGINGSVCNQLGRVEIVAQGRPEQLYRFRQALITDAPQIAAPVLTDEEPLQLEPLHRFEILPSESGGKASIHLPADFFTCADCLRELNDPQDRRFGYPFINCTQCGPRYTLIRSLPYDRPGTSMAGFPLCPACEAEYTDPLDRRFHAEPIACPVCGPRLSWTMGDAVVEASGVALAGALDALRAGKVLAVKGIGGYHLMCDARNERAVVELRKRKHRPDKPLAVMFASEGATARAELDRIAVIAEHEWQSLAQPARPIVLLRKSGAYDLAPSIAPGLRDIGVMLAYSPLHALMLGQFNGPLVATSGNLSGEPVITSRTMAAARLAGIADGFLHHDRPIVRPADDSVLRPIAGQLRSIRIGRGLAPEEFELPRALPEPVLALGGHMKAAIALAWDRRLVVSPHIGEMDSPRSRQVFEQLVAEFPVLYGVEVGRYICDAHPDYASTRWAARQDLPVTRVWHHHAHAASLELEFPRPAVPDRLVFTWDGVGLGPDQTLWGGEAMMGRAGNWRRYAHWRPFNLPGGDLAGRAPWRSAAALCWSAGEAFECPRDIAPSDLDLLQSAWEKRVNSPQTTATGRLFDAASALLGLAEQASFEGQGPMLLEALAEDIEGAAVEIPINADPGTGSLRLDWSPLLRHMLDARLSVPQRAADWHESLATAILEVARICREAHAIEQVGFSGGVFQNRLLTERAISLLQAQGFDCLLPSRVPVNDGGLCVGQVIEYLHQISN